jgi:DNA-binding transcriptional regulator YhcF (GntR family)
VLGFLSNYLTGVAIDSLTRLQKLIAQAKGGPLPSVRSLASAWDVSPSHVQKVIREAQARGWIETRPGSGMWRAGEMPPRRAYPKRAGMDAIVTKITEGIQAGHWGGGERLPSPKLLAETYRVHPATVRKALHRLLDKNLIERKGQSWNVVRPRRSQARAPVLWCFGAHDAAGDLKLGSDREWEFWREIQSEAMRNGLSTEMRGWSGQWPKAEAKPIGAVVSTWHLPDPYPLLSALHRAKIPAAVWLENPYLAPGLISIRSPWLGFHDMAYGKEAGGLVAKHAAVSRHARIAWISPFHGALWSRNRLDGLRKNLPKGNLVHEALGPWVSEWDFQNALWQDARIWDPIPLDAIGAVSDEASRVELMRPILEAIGWNQLFEAFEPQLEEALHSEATLWIAASDRIALKCMDWLAAKGVSVPKRIAVLGFDDSREAFRRGLTSFRFDAQAMARAMVRQVLMPKSGVSRVFSYQGTLVVRGSTGG